MISSTRPSITEKTTATPPDAPVTTTTETVAVADTTTIAPKQTTVEPTNKGDVTTVTPKVETPNSDSSDKTTDFNLNSFLKEKSGGLFSDEEQFKSHLEKIKSIGDIDAVISEKNTLVEKEKELSEKYSKVSQEAEEYKPANEFIASLNKLVKEGAGEKQIHDFYQLSQTNLENLTPKEAKIMRLERETGLTREDAEFEVSFGLDSDKHDEDVIRRNEIALKREFKENIEWLKNQKKELSTVPRPDSEILKKVNEEERTKQIKAITDISPNIAKDINNITIDIPLDKEKSINFDYVFGDDFKEVSSELIQNLIIGNKVNINDANQIKEVKEQAKRLYIATNPERFATAVIKHYESLKNEEAALANAKSVNRNTTNGQAVAVNPKSATGRATIKFHDLKPIK